MARQVENSLPPPEQTDEQPAPSSDALDRSVEALRESLDQAEQRWRQLETRLADQDRAIRELQDELRRVTSDRFTPAVLGAAGVPELTEIVRPVGDPGS